MSDWQKVQGAKCGCRGQDEMCPCQNVDFSAPSEAVNQSQARVSGDELAIAAMDLCNALYGLGYGQMGAPGLPGEIDTLTDLLERWSRPAPVSPAVDGREAELATLRSQLELAVGALEYARPLLQRYAHTQGDNAEYHAGIVKPIDEALASIKSAQLKGGSDGVS